MNKAARLLYCCLVALGGSLALPQSSQAEVVPSKPGPGIFFVATNGNDQWTGGRPTPTWTKKDGPFATLPRALKAAREWRQHQTGTSTRPPTILMRGGEYFLREPVVLGLEDSGLTLAAYRTEKPVISGGRRISGWKETTLSGQKVWMAELPEVRQGQWFFRELWVNGQRAVRARHPNQGYLSVAGVLDGNAKWDQGQQRFAFAPNDLGDWPTVTQAEVVVMNRWVESRLPIAHMDEKAHVVDFAKRSVFGLAKGDLYYAEGALEFLDQPGEWYLDRNAGTLYYLPRAGEKLKNFEVVAPSLAQVLRLQGQPKSGRCVEHVLVHGLTFAHTEWCFPEGFEKSKDAPTISPEPKGEVGGFAQAAVGVPGAVWGEGVRECVWENCAFIHLGTYGLELARGCTENRVSGCEFADLGGGGVKLGETGIREAASEQTRGNEVSDCHIHDGGKLFHSAIGIWVGQSASNRLLHNEIDNFYYTGISMGWTWGYGPAAASNNLVAYNHVHHIGKKANGDGPILSDMGGIYTLGMQPGTRIVNNLWHDMAGLRYGGWGIYLDEGSSGMEVASNVVYRTTHGGFHQHYGATNHVWNNVFAFARDHQVQRTRPEAHVSFSFETNIVYFDSGVLLGGNWSGDQYQLDRNLYFDARPGAKPEGMRFAGATLEAWRARGHDQHSLVADPLFVAPQQNDFRLQPGSPAFKLGFRDIDLTCVGIRKDKGYQ